MLPLGASLLGPAVAAAFFSFFVIVFYLFILAILAFAAGETRPSNLHFPLAP